MPNKRQAFISYSHKNSSTLLDFVTHTKLMELTLKKIGFEFWYDQRRLGVGENIDQHVQQAIQDSQVFVILVSAHFFNSNYIMDFELPAILKIRQDLPALLIPVILEDMLLTDNFFDEILYTPEPPIEKWQPPKDGLVRAARDVCRAVLKWYDVKPATLMSLFEE